MMLFPRGDRASGPLGSGDRFAERQGAVGRSGPVSYETCSFLHHLWSKKARKCLASQEWKEFSEKSL